MVFPLSADGNGFCVSQEPQAGKIVPVGTTVGGRFPDGCRPVRGFTLRTGFPLSQGGVTLGASIHIVRRA